MANKAVGFLTFNFGANMGGFNKAMKKAQRSVGKFGKSMKRIGSSMTTNLTMPIVGLGAIAIKTFADFEEAMLKVKAVSGATASEFKSLEANAKRLGSSTMFTATQVAELQLELSKLGLTPEEINKSTDSILSLAQATSHDLAESASIVASTMNSFGLEASESAKVADMFAAASSNAAIDMEKLGTAMPTVGATANAVGVPLDDLTAMMMTLSDSGMEASTMGTHLRKIFVELATKGISFEQAMNMINSSTDKVTTATELFGKRAFGAGLILAGNTEKTSEYNQMLDKSAGKAKEMADIMDSGASGAMRRLASQAEGVAISLGGMLIPVFQKIMGLIQKGLSFWSGLDGEMKKNIVTIGLIVGAIGPVISILGTLATAFGLIMSPVGLVVAAIVAGAFLIHQNWEPIKKLIVNIANNFIDLYNESMIFRGGIQLIILNFKNLWANVKFVFNAMKGLATNIIGTWIKQFKAVGKVITAALKFDTDGVKEGAKDWADATVDGLKDNAKILIDEAKVLGDEIAENIKTGIDNTLSRDKIDFITEDDIQGAVDSAADVATGIYDQIKGVFEVGSGGGSGESGATEDNGPILGDTEKLVDTYVPINKELEKTKTLLDVLEEKFGLTKEAMMGFAEQTGTSLAQGAASFAEYGEQVKNSIKEVISGLISQGVAAAVSGAMQAAGANPILIPIVAGLASGLAKTAFNSLIPAFADGGIVSGPTVGLMGEYAGAGAGNPEVIAPLNKLKGMMGSGQQNVVVEGRINGNDIWLSNSKTNGERNRGI
tara:strand:+ start:1222 stop:3552 length:2331 start_codon:yes stop_codon:yes gene_type:complete